MEGIFRRCCEETLSVMRTNKEALLTIIEVIQDILKSLLKSLLENCLLHERNKTYCNLLQVFIHDPLYKWALSPLKALQRQQVIN